MAATCHLHKLFICLCIRRGTYIYVPICVHTIKIHELLNKVVSFIVLEVSFDTGTILNFWLMGLGCPLLGESSDRRLRRCAATATSAAKTILCLKNEDQHASPPTEILLCVKNAQVNKKKQVRRKMNFHETCVYQKLVFTFRKTQDILIYSLRLQPKRKR